MTWRAGTIKAAAVAGLAAALLAVLTVLAVPGGAWARAGETDTIVSISEFDYSGGIGDGLTFRLAAGQQSPLFNQEVGSDHNVVAIDDGPDGQPNFSSVLAATGQTVPVNGTQYLEPGSYAFYCTIHQFGGMHGTIQVTGTGAVPRPDVSVAVASKKLKNLSSGKLKVSVAATTQSDDVSVEARVGGKAAGSATDLDLAAGQKQTLTLNLGKDAKKAVKTGLKKDEKVAVSVSSEVPWGAPDSAKKKLK